MQLRYSLAASVASLAFPAKPGPTVATTKSFLACAGVTRRGERHFYHVPPPQVSPAASRDYSSKPAAAEAAAVSEIHQKLRQLRSPPGTTPVIAKMKHLSNLDIMKETDAFPYEDTEPDAFRALSDMLYTLVWKDGQPLGYMLASTVSELEAVPEAIRGPVTVDASARTVRAFEGPGTEAGRSALVAAVMGYWRERGTFDVLRGWRDEPWPVYGAADEVLYSAERSGTGMLGVMRYGVHMMGYVRDDRASHGLRIWVPRRAANKSTYPNMLDNTVAGGLMTGENPLECIIREADEEADLPEDLVRSRAVHTGIVTYIYVTDERAGGEAGQIYPEMQWVYEMELPAGVTPTPKDGEVAEFHLWTVERVRGALAAGEFKPNCALVLLDFFVRHGVLTRENEPDYDEIVRRMHRKLPFPGPHQALMS